MSYGLNKIIEVFIDLNLETTPSKNNLVGTIPRWGPAFKISFQVFIVEGAQSDTFRNILRFTATDNDCCNVGDRLPGLWLRNNGALYLGTQIGTDGDKVFQSPVLEKNKWFNIEYEQSFVNNQVDIVFYTVSVNILRCNSISPHSQYTITKTLPIKTLL